MMNSYDLSVVLPDLLFRRERTAMKGMLKWFSMDKGALVRIYKFSQEYLFRCTDGIYK